MRVDRLMLRAMFSNIYTFHTFQSMQFLNTAITPPSLFKTMTGAELCELSQSVVSIDGSQLISLHQRIREHAVLSYESQIGLESSLEVKSHTCSTARLTALD